MEDLSRISNKVDQIVEAAQRLFGVYGFEKVSMSEISAELNLSKASLYYYFPDKMGLFIAVIEKEQAEFFSRISEITNESSDPEGMLRDYAILRLVHFRRLLNLSRFRQESFSDMRPGFRETFRKFKEKEKEVIMAIYDTGNNSGIFAIKQTDETASLFLDLLRGIGASVIKEKRTLVIEQAEYDTLLYRTTMFTDIFIKGLKFR